MKKAAVLTLALALAVVPAFANTATIPTFRSGFNSGAIQGWVQITNGDTAAQVVTVTYTAENPANTTQQFTFLLGARGITSWEIVQDLGLAEGTGSTIPNMTVQSNSDQARGSVTLTAPNDIFVSYIEVDLVINATSRNTGVHVP